MNIEELIKLSKESEDLNRALEFAHEAIDLNPNAQQAWANLGWVYHRFIKNTEDEEEKWSYLKQYISLYHHGNIRNPVLHRSMAQFALQYGKPGLDLVEFWRFWDLRTLTEDDFKNKPAPNGYVFLALAPRIASSLSKALLELKDPLQIQGALPHIQKIFTYANDEWGDYYIARLYLCIKNERLAKEHFQRAMRNLSRQSWFWASYAQCFDAYSENKANCLATALLLQPNSNENHKLELHEEIGQYFLKIGLLGYAKNALESALIIRQKEGLATDELSALLSGLKEVKTIENHQDQYKKMSFQAFIDSQVIEECTGWVIDEFTRPDQDKTKQLYLLAYMSKNQSNPSLNDLRTLAIPTKIFERNLAKGQVLRLFVCENAEQKENLVSFDILDQEELWMGYPTIKAVITGIAEDQRRFYLSTEELENLSFFVDLFDRVFNIKIDQSTIGSKIVLAIAPQREDFKQPDLNKKIKVLSARFYEGDVDFCRVFKGKLKLHEKGFGFLQNEVPIHIGQHLLKAKQYKDGDDISLLAVLGVHQGERKWSAVTWVI